MRATVESRCCAASRSWPAQRCDRDAPRRRHAIHHPGPGILSGSVDHRAGDVARGQLSLAALLERPAAAQLLRRGCRCYATILFRIGYLISGVRQISHERQSSSYSRWKCTAQSRAPHALKECVDLRGRLGGDLGML